MQFNATHLYKDVFSYINGYNHIGKKPFTGNWDRDRHRQFLYDVIIPQNISAGDWPYRNIEDDFYSWNTLGYRTYPFEEITNDTEFDLALGCSFVEGIGVRINERWDYHYENYFGRKLVNLGKGGASVNAMSYIGHGWFLANRPKPKRIIMVWTEPLRDTYVVDNSTPLHFLPNYERPKEYDITVRTYVQMYNLSLPIEQYWSNKFVQIYNEFNLLTKAMNIPTFNFLLEDLWPPYNLIDLQNYLIASITPINFIVDCSWYPRDVGADGVHPGAKGHFSAFKTIKETIENEQS